MKMAGHYKLSGLKIQSVIVSNIAFQSIDPDLFRQELKGEPGFFWHLNQENIVIIPHTQLSTDALHGLIEEFITREGTDYGWDEVPLSQKVAQVQRQIEKGEVVIVFDSASESVSLLTRRDANQLDQDE